MPGKLFAEPLDRVVRKMKLVRAHIGVHLDQRAPHVVDHGGVAQSNTVRGRRSFLSESCS